MRPSGRVTRREAGLPERGFVFGSFNNTFKILPHMFDVSIPEQSGIKTLPSNIDPRSDAVCYEALWRATPGFRHTTPGAWKLSKVCK